MNINFSKSQFSLLKKTDDNFADNILQYLYLDSHNVMQETYIIIYNYLIQISCDLFKKQKDYKYQHRIIFEMDGLFRTYFYYLEHHPMNNNIIIDKNWKEVAKNMYNYVHSFWTESYGIDWTKLNKVLTNCDVLTKNTISQTNEVGYTYNATQYSFNNCKNTYNVIK